MEASAGTECAAAGARDCRDTTRTAHVQHSKHFTQRHSSQPLTSKESCFIDRTSLSSYCATCDTIAANPSSLAALASVMLETEQRASELQGWGTPAPAMLLVLRICRWLLAWQGAEIAVGLGAKTPCRRGGHASAGFRGSLSLSLSLSLGLGFGVWACWAGGRKLSTRG